MTRSRAVSYAFSMPGTNSNPQQQLCQRTVPIVLGSVKAVVWGRISWELQEFSGVAHRHMRVDREYQHALDEARDRATQFGIVD
jgi:hypothetical protein